MDFNRGDLVLVRLNNDPKYKGRQRHYNIWLRVEFKDTDGTFHGRVERKDNDYELDEIGHMLQINNEKVLSIYDPNDGKQWCYSDGVTRCDCRGLCRNK